MRSDIIHFKNKQGIIDLLSFDGKDMNRKYVPRPRLPQTEKQTTPFKYNFEGEHRVQEAIHKQSPVNLDNFNMFRTQVKPDFKVVEKQKWLAGDDFKIASNPRKYCPVRLNAWE